MLKLNSTWLCFLLNKPESGMGYQIVEVTTFDNKVRRGTAYNAELLVFESEQHFLFQADNYRQLLSEASLQKDNIKSLEVVPNAESVSPAFALKETAIDYVKKSTGAKDAPEERTKENEVFKRFTAYEKDNRITSDGQLRPGTYATTEEDAIKAPTGKIAVMRYALPNPKPASYKWTIKPLKDTVIQYGIVEPAFGQPGGGVEVFFRKGTHPGTIDLKPEKIPDE